MVTVGQVSGSPPVGFTAAWNRGTVAELAEFGATRCSGVGSRDVSVDLAGLSSGENAFVAFGGRPASRRWDEQLTVTLANTLAGPRDLVASRGTIGSVDGAASVLRRMVVRRDLDPNEGASLGTLNLATDPDGFDPAAAPITVQFNPNLIGVLQVSFGTATSPPAPIYADVARVVDSLTMAHRTRGGQEVTIT